jgi:cyclohexanecarboxylate-CoA ligase
LVDKIGITSSDVDPIAFPIAHIGGAVMLAAALVTGMRLALFEVFDPATTQLGRQVRETFGLPGIANAWGLTEFPVATSPSLTSPPEVLDHTVGRPGPGVSVRVVDGREIELPAGHEGELRLKGPQCFLGYADPTLDAEAFDADGWLRTGDLGVVDANGNVRVTGRIKDAIIRNAENVSALEVENALATHPAVADVAVIGVPDPRTGERVCAVVVPESGDGVSLESLVQHCRSQGLSRYKHPERLEIVDALPRNQFGKVIKKDLREAFG